MSDPGSALFRPLESTLYDRVNRTRGSSMGRRLLKEVEAWLWDDQAELKFPDTPATLDPPTPGRPPRAVPGAADAFYVGRDASTTAPHAADGKRRSCYRRQRQASRSRGRGSSAIFAGTTRSFRAGPLRRQPADDLAAHHAPAHHELQRYALTLPAAESPDEIIRTFQVAIASLPESARVLVFDALKPADA